MPERIESSSDEIVNFLAILLATRFPQFTKKVWKTAIKNGKTKPPIPIIPEPRLTQEASIATAIPNTKASLASILLEPSVSKFVEVLFWDLKIL